MSGTARVVAPSLLVALLAAAGCAGSRRGLPPQTGSALYVGPGLACAEPGQAGQIVVDNRTQDAVEVVRLDGKTRRQTVVGSAPPGRAAFPLPEDTTTYTTYLPRSIRASGDGRAGVASPDRGVTFTLLCGASGASGAAASGGARAGDQP